MLGGNNEIDIPLFTEVSKNEYFGNGLIKHDRNELEVEFCLTLTASRAFVSFSCPNFFFEIIDGFVLTGELADKKSVKASVRGNISIKNRICHAECFDVIIGQIKGVSVIETTLLGIYFLHPFSFEYAEQTIAVFKSTHDRQLALRTHQISGAILEGSRIRVEGDNLDINTTNDLLRDICFLLRIISSSQVYFSQLSINDGQAIVYGKKRMLGKLFGLRENVLNSTLDLSNYLKNGLIRYRSLEKDDRQTIINTGYDLSTSAACGLMETGLMTLISSLERLGCIAKSNQSKKVPDQSKGECLSGLKLFLKTQLKEYLSRCGNTFSEIEMENLIKSVSKLQYWDVSFIQSIKAHLQENGWIVELDFQMLKQVRDSLAHSGMLPGELSSKKRHELTQQLEDFLLIHALDLLGVRMLVAAGKDGWTTYLNPEDIKFGQNRSER